MTAAPASNGTQRSSVAKPREKRSPTDSLRTTVDVSSCMSDNRSLSCRCSARRRASSSSVLSSAICEPAAIVAFLLMLTRYNAPVLIEAETIPYEPAQLRGERLLVLAPHPDDEVIGCGGLVALHLHDGRQVRVVIATDGGEAGEPAERQRESRAALASLGSAEIEFLNFPDRHLRESGGFAAALRDILVDFRPDLIAAPSPIEIHPDHFALARTLCDVIARDATLF